MRDLLSPDPVNQTLLGISHGLFPILLVASDSFGKKLDTGARILYVNRAHSAVGAVF